MYEVLDSWLPAWLAVVSQALIAAVLLVGFIGGLALLLIWAERKVSGRMQDRLGPTRVGPIGLLQSFADGIKLITKEDTTPAEADRFLFRFAPYMAFCATFCAFIALPFAPAIVPCDVSIGVFFVMAVMATEVFGVLLAGYSSGSKWSMFGGIREAAQVVSYEVPRSLCVIIPVAIAGTLSLTELAKQQSGYFWNWRLFHDPFTFLAFFVFFITATASCKRAPFDLAEAESELVAGFHTEYSGIRWSYFFMAEYGSMYVVSAVASLLYLGGWNPGLLPFDLVDWLGPWLGNFCHALILIGKSFSLIFVMMWMRWSLPRLRIDQVMTCCLKYFLPISCGLLLGTCLWILWIPNSFAEGIRIILASATFISLVVVAVLVSRPLPAEGMPGQLAGVWSGKSTLR